MPYEPCDDEVSDLIATVLKNWHRDRLKLKLTAKLHDWNLGGFRVIAERQREHALEVICAQAFALTHGQLLFGFAGPFKVAGGEATMTRGKREKVPA